MPLAPGTTIGPYQITGAIGAGGMGEVYRARDTKLQRDAAIKVLPAGFAQDESGVARLRREAQLLASLNHPHVASICGLEETSGALALALELVEGEDLAERLARGAIPVEEAIGYARQLIDGLEAAHEKGIVHATPPGVRRLLTRCLERDARKRLRDIGDARPELLDLREPSVATAAAAPAQGRWRMLPWGLAAAAALVASRALWGRSDAPAQLPTHLEIAYPPNVEPYIAAGSTAMSPDGRTVAMLGVQDGTRRLLARRLDQREASEVPDTSGANTVAFSPAGAVNDFPSSAGPDPDSVLVVRVRPETSGDVFLISTSGAFEPRALVETPAYQGGAQLSPDGRFLLYQSNASGRAEIYVRPYPALDRQWQASEGGGVQARWSRTSREVYYRTGKQLMAVPIATAAPSRSSASRWLSSPTSTTSAWASATRTMTSRPRAASSCSGAARTAGSCARCCTGRRS